MSMLGIIENHSPSATEGEAFSSGLIPAVQGEAFAELDFYSPPPPTPPRVGGVLASEAFSLSSLLKSASGNHMATAS